MIPYGRQSISEADIEAVVEVLKSDFLTQGPVVPRFEQAVADYCGARFGVAVNSGTAALHIACLALGVGPGDWVWTSPISFVASANCALYCGAQVDFVDIEPDTGNMCAMELERKLVAAKAQGCLPKVVIPVHFAGLPCDMQEIHRLGQEYGFRIIEDACHALGARYHDEPTGNCRYSDITVFSFHPVKIITTGEGGMAMTNDPALAKTMSMLRSHGITRDPADFINEPDGPWYYEQQMLGFNYRMTDIQAALGLSQMARLEEFLVKRRKIAARYQAELPRPGLKILAHRNGRISAWHLFVIKVPAEHRKTLFVQLKEAGIVANVHYMPISAQPAHRRKSPADTDSAHQFYQAITSIPLYPMLSGDQQNKVIEVLRRA
ncbi:UDP-4-amino-4,6-dideoxy-N-acetyl-beta-L-altrosamine transaminase [Aeromonas hydrophila]|uniref:Lipopolysaccharide O-Ag biosynthesis protein FlmB n=1 Tax=Aeromonas hydrophila subsp. hydrophila (strain ATCC 7966 / DSM 30187 / BCRC 13018 / CCUG 14551 / JCM 1027 / KCTC 2358 / NCIMB 9240 / NCTC 8049) TaxID=380703 RepID=A0KQM3_AERHH|nr:UDP-4-amino-4,6-dideoxy-N-acetyl-beta-L-altrosamine transaminase [Aeromonas hydrophila]ABK37250.1 lipopolysaccharide O-Ag biosynthesis protein FlmB [Aeromonas hydrophila subsp. hydrophila ATCC 7966]MBS4673398.1 UDP-4-amino-4,6-dideoxy-N-acetyl-beta-L-altrosamine transaminase [Aeromonas hydrophila]OOD33867.1 UDP-4-amino-4,6-dideoxy-N-acetyl-beta-L-altrosamine transaminase [Aeromonas hydrophila]SUU33355.1 lipopolysaccharide O-Ag biosynthesis protein FlmB [Aeromonas hydrophila]HEG4447130.1 UDP